MNGLRSSAPNVRQLSEAVSFVWVLRLNDSGTTLCASTNGEVLLMRPQDTVMMTFRSIISSIQPILRLSMLSDSTSFWVVVVLSDAVHGFNISGAMIKRLGLGSLETFGRSYSLSTPEAALSSFMRIGIQRMSFLWIESNPVQIVQLESDQTYLFNVLCSVSHLNCVLYKKGKGNPF
ncbi:unnamed protein product [Phytomonas sp. Hart1]|nr:unnamed protein product [Phytomonas sp. Hart1]|eukprot:CCW72164.1 unnamed protein product [Phytomonas sp. isolate Hart1]